MKETLVIVLFIIFNSSGLYAGKAYIDDFISGDGIIGARVSGLGNAGVTSIIDATSIIYNPSSMLNTEVPSVSLNGTMLFFGAKNYYAGYIQPFKTGRIGLGIVQLNADDRYFVGRDEFGNLTGNFSVKYSALLLAYCNGYEIKNRTVRLGCTLKNINTLVQDSSHNGLDINLGGTYLINERFRIGCHLNNLMRTSISGDKLPLRFNFGGSYSFLNNKLLSLIQIDAASGQFNFHTGLEYKPNRLIEFRMGVEDKKISGGFGLYYSDLRIDYVFKKITDNLLDEYVSTFSLNWWLSAGKVRRLKIYTDHREKARQFVNSGKLEEAIKELMIAQSVLKKNRDKTEYEGVIFQKESIQRMIENQKKEKNRIEKESETHYRKGLELMDENKFNLARAELNRVSETSSYYEESQKLIQQCIDRFNDLTARQENEIKLTKLNYEYETSRDIEYKLQVGRMILKLKNNPKIKAEIKEIENKKYELERRTKEMENRVIKSKLEKINREKDRIDRINELKDLTERFLKASDITEKIAVGEFILEKHEDNQIKKQLNKLKNQSKEMIDFGKKLKEIRTAYEQRLKDKLEKRMEEQFYEVEDIDLRISLGKTILEKRYVPDIEKELNSLIEQKKFEEERRKREEEKEIRSRLKKIEDEEKRLQIETLKANANEYYRNGYLKLAKENILKIQEITGDKTYMNSQLLKIDSEISREFEKQQKQAAIKSLYNESMRLYFNGKLVSARNTLERLFIEDPSHAEGNDLYAKITKDLARKKRKPEEYISKTGSEEVMKYNAAKIDRLIKESLSLYTVGRFDEAKAKLEEVLKIDPGNKQAQKYMMRLER